MSGFGRLTDVYRGREDHPDLIALALQLATTPRGPLYDGNVSPDRELAAFLRAVAP
jgi:hypothetical protein